MKIGFLQFGPKHLDPTFNLKFIRAYLEAADFDLLVLPELANTAYLQDDKAALLAASEPADGSGVFLSGLIAIARKHEACIVSGFSERDGSRLFNSAVAVDGTGVINHYRKTHLFYKEKDLFKTGDSGFSVFGFKGVIIGTMVCFDWFFPESARTLVLKGAQIIAHPANLVLPWCQNAMVTRSLENHVFSITANRVGSETGQDEEMEFTGASQILDPNGTRLAQAAERSIQLAIVEVDPVNALNKHLNAYNDLFEDRKPLHYRH
jgi:predicted amidohydrolase